MIRKFAVENFLSICDRQSVSFEVKGPESEIVSMMADGTFLNKLAIFYGANASGKSNMLIAMEVVFNILFTPLDNNKDIPVYLPFKLKESESTTLFVSFYARDVLYEYEVRYTESSILSESMYYYPNKSKALFYQRRYVGEDLQADIKFGDSLRLLAKTKNSITENTFNNSSVLSVCGKIVLMDDAAPFVLLYNYIKNHYHNIDGDKTEEGLVSLLKEVESNAKKKRFFNKMLEKADLNILDFHPITVDRVIPETLKNEIQKSKDMPETVRRKLLEPKDNIIFTNHSDNGDFNIPMELQSKGTLAYLRKLDVLYDLITQNHTYLMDELDEDLHYDMLVYYLNVFLFNSDSSQLLLTSQETALLSEDLLNENRSLVWFVEKDRSTASSVFSRGDTFGLHKNLSMYSCYKAGRLGAKPELGSIFIDMEEE